jgi:hypothetical protein
MCIHAARFSIDIFFIERDRIMKKLCVVLGLMFASSAPALAQEMGFVFWNDIVGVITAQGVDNPVSANIDSGTFAWTTSGGHAKVDMANGTMSFGVKGLVINGTMFSGTPGPITAVTGTLVCNPGDPTQEAALDSPAVPLDARGNASFSGPIQSVPAPCANPLFLVRIAIPAGAAGRWIATGAVRTMGADSQ